MDNGFAIFANSQLENEQSGYRVDIEEQSLVGSNNGDWKKKTWFVIGQADIVGDPIFIEGYRKVTNDDLYQKSEMYIRK